MWLEPIAESSEASDFASLLRNYEDVFDATVLSAMSGEPFKINFKPNATPYAQLKARKCAISYLEQLKKQLQEKEQLRVMPPHKEPSPWCHPIVIAQKKGTD